MKHKKSTIPPVKGPLSPVRKNKSPVKEKHKFPVRELFLSPMREDQSPVRVVAKTGKKRQGESKYKEKIKKEMPNEEVFNQDTSQTDG